MQGGIKIPAAITSAASAVSNAFSKVRPGLGDIWDKCTSTLNECCKYLLGRCGIIAESLSSDTVGTAEDGLEPQGGKTSLTTTPAAIREKITLLISSVYGKAIEIFSKIIGRAKADELAEPEAKPADTTGELAPPKDDEASDELAEPEVRQDDEAPDEPNPAAPPADPATKGTKPADELAVENEVSDDESADEEPEVKPNDAPELESSAPATELVDETNHDEAPVQLEAPDKPNPAKPAELEDANAAGA